MQTLLLHRYAPHGMFRLSQAWERTFYVLTYVFQACRSQSLAFARMHRAHHAYSDRERSAQVSGPEERAAGRFLRKHWNVHQFLHLLPSRPTRFSV
jgi:fatty-acid desaturase